MQAVMISRGLAGSGWQEQAGCPALLLSYRPKLAKMPVVTAMCRAFMGGTVGMMFAGLAANAAFWIAMGVVLGVALDAIASRTDRAAPDQAGPSPLGPYRVR